MYGHTELMDSRSTLEKQKSLIKERWRERKKWLKRRRMDESRKEPLRACYGDENMVLND